jgi:type IV pilus assembly protein PilC
MNRYSFKLINEVGKVEKGVLDALSVDGARSELDAREGVTIIDLAEIKGLRSVLNRIVNYILYRGVFVPQLKPNDVLYLIRELYTFLDAGMSLSDAITTLRGFIKKRSFAFILDDIADRLKKGHPFSACLEKFPTSFSHGFIASIKGGEISGEMGNILKDSYEFLAWEQKTKKRIITLATFPIAVCGLLSGVFFVMIFFLIPRVIPFLRRSGREIPKVTQFLIQFRAVVLAHRLTIFGVIFGIIAAIIIFSLTKRGRFIIDRLLFKLPVFGYLYHTFALMLFCKTFYILNSSGMRIMESLKICKNLYREGGWARQEVGKVMDKIEKGGSLGNSVDKSPFFPRLLTMVMKSAERTGSLSDKLKSMGELYANRMEYRLTDLLAYIEPAYAIMIIIYIVFLLFGFYLPMISVVVPK